MKRLVRRSLSVLDTMQLGSVARQVQQERLTYLSPAKLSRLDRAARAAFADVLDGCAVEFGVALGGSGIVLADLARQHGATFHGFDVFGMIPPPVAAVDDEKSQQRYATIAAGRSSGIDGDKYYGYRPDLHGDVCAAFARHGLPVDGATIVLHKGLFEDTLPACSGLRVAIAHIDCDWYDPVSLCLRWLSDHVEPGGRIVVDDYHDYGGCRRAVDELLAANGAFRMELGPNVVLRRE